MQGLHLGTSEDRLRCVSTLHCTWVCAWGAWKVWASECMHGCLCQCACMCLGAGETSHTTLSRAVLWFCGTVKAGCTSLLRSVGWQGCSEPWEQHVFPKAGKKVGSIALCLWGR